MLADSSTSFPIEPDPSLVIPWATLQEWLTIQVAANASLKRRTSVGRELDSLEAACLRETEVELGCAIMLLSQFRSAGESDRALRYLMQCALDLGVETQVLP
jgi:hypothetical protein